MGKPLGHIPVKLIIGLLSNQNSRLGRVKRALEKKFGPIDRETELINFVYTRYYEKELGQNLKRKFLSFKKLIYLNKCYRIKLYTNKIEKAYSENNLRTVNIDPGYVSPAKLVLFTTKNQSDRIYLDKGIYADLELQFKKKSFQPVERTYYDYKSPEYIGFFNSVREAYMLQIKKGILP